MFGIDRCEEVKSSRWGGYTWCEVSFHLQLFQTRGSFSDGPKLATILHHLLIIVIFLQSALIGERGWALRYFYALSPAAAPPAPPHSSNFWPHSWGWHCHHWTELCLWPLTVQLEVWLSVVPSRNSGVRVPVLSLLPGYVNTPRNDH